MICNPILEPFHSFNENRIASVIAALTLTLGVNGPLHCQRWTLIQTRTQIPQNSDSEIGRRDPSPSLCNVKCSAQYNVTIWFGFRI